MLWLSRSEFDRYARFKSHGSAREVFDWEQLCNVELPVPPIENQKRVLAIKQAIERRIASLAKLNDYLTELGVFTLSEMVNRKSLISVAPSEILGIELPSGLTAQKISEFCISMNSGSTPSRSDSRYWDNATIPWVKSGEACGSSINTTEELISEIALEETSVKLFQPGTILIAMYGVTAGQVGYLDIAATTNQAICGMKCDSAEKTAFLFFSLLRSQEEIARLSNGGAQDNLSKKVIGNILIPVPSEEVIQSAPLRLLLEGIVANCKEKSYLVQLRDVLLPKLMAGKLKFSEIESSAINNHSLADPNCLRADCMPLFRDE